MLRIENVNKIYSNGICALQDINFKVNEDDFITLIGLSGSGKTTLMKAIDGVLSISSGRIFFKEQEITRLSDKDKRRQGSQIAMIFQDFHLLPRTKVITNVLSGALGRVSTFSSLFHRFPADEVKKAHQYLDMVGLMGREDDRIERLSGGERQRVAIARALMQKPTMLLADEPVSNLDPVTATSMLEYLEVINKELGVTIICSLHLTSLVKRFASKVIALKKGKMLFEGSADQLDDKFLKSIFGEKAAHGPAI